MGGAASSNKGKGAERDLCKILSGIFGGSFIRADASGAYVGGRNSWRMNHLSEGQIKSRRGDVIPPDELPKMVIESKFYKEFRFHHLLSGPARNALLDEWIDQCLEIAKPEDVWMICFKVNRLGFYVAFPSRLAKGLDLGSHAVYLGKEEMVITELKHFFEANKQAITTICS